VIGAAREAIVFEILCGRRLAYNPQRVTTVIRDGPEGAGDLNYKARTSI
jgi:hypothetical protein